MTKLLTFLLLVTLLHCNLANAQSPSDYLPNKPGKWTYSNNITSTEAEYIAFSKVMASLAEWFHINIPMLKNPKGFDLAATTYGGWDKYYRMNKCNYGLRTELDFCFQLFFSAGGKWTIEPPHYSFDINNTETGHGTNPNYPFFDELQDDPGLEKAINDASLKMNGVFPVFEFVKQIEPGIDLYREAADAYPHHLVVYNPERPPYWIPVTVREMAEMHLQYYKLRNKIEMDRMLLAQLEKEISELSEDELTAPAFLGHDEHFVLKVNGKGEGLQFMRFNPDYWDRSRPKSDIQFMTFYYPQMTDSQMEESYKNNGHPFYSQLLVNEIDWRKLAELIKMHDFRIN
jgi:hypothetical protein